MADVILPSLGESITEGIIVRWFKAVGDPIERDEPILEISTDKVDSELPAPASGVVTSILFEEGDTVEVGATVAVIGDAGDVPAPAAPAPVPAATPEPAAPAPPAPPAPVAPVTSTSGGVVTSPMVRRVLSDAGLDATEVEATGPGGRITRSDAERAVSRPATAPRRASAPGLLDGGSATSLRGFVAVEADYESVARAKRAAAARVAEAEGVGLDEVVFAVRAAVEALAEHPLLNASITADGIELNASRNIGVALDLDGHLLVPVIADAQDLNLRGLSRRLADVAARAKSGELGVDDLLGGSFTVTAPASSQVLVSIPQLIEPQVAVLSVGGIARKAVVLTDEDGTDSIAIRSIGILGLAFDSRVVDATTATRFLERTAALLASQDWTAEL